MEAPCRRRHAPSGRREVSPLSSASMRQLPVGIATFLFTDIEGSTRLLHELGSAYGTVLAEHRRMVREVIALHGGVEVGTQGDAVFVVFSSPDVGVNARAEVPERAHIG